MNEFLEYLLKFGSLPSSGMDLLSKKARELVLYKKQFYWEAGKTVKQIGFLQTGILRVYYYTEKGEETTRYFIDENHLILDGDGSEGNYVPAEYLEALTDSKLITFSRPDWNEISRAIPGWDGLIQKITAKQHREKIQRRSDLVAQDAATRYLEFIEKFPTLVNRVPLTYIASYLGITQSSLSRIRKNIR